MTKAAERDTPEIHLLSRLFTIRVWCEHLGEGRSEWRGQVKDATSGEVRYFRDWQALVPCIQEMLASDVSN